jgi:hypothetical protein
LTTISVEFTFKTIMGRQPSSLIPRNGHTACADVCAMADHMFALANERLNDQKKGRPPG